jgi:type IV pilus assembly protein PilQ
VTFNFQDVPVRTVLQLIAEESGLNVVAADTVQGNVTLRLVNVPWDQALDIVLQAKGLDKRRSGNVVWIAPQAEIAKYEQDKEDARIALDNRVDLVTEYIQVNYHNAAAIYKALTEAKGIGGGPGRGAVVRQGNQNDNGFLSQRGRLGCRRPHEHFDGERHSEEGRPDQGAGEDHRPPGRPGHHRGAHRDRDRDVCP